MKTVQIMFTLLIVFLLGSCIGGQAPPTPDFEATSHALAETMVAEEKEPIPVDISTEAPQPISVTELPPTVEPTKPILRNRVIALESHVSTLTTLEGLAFEQGINFTRFAYGDEEDFLNELKKPDVLAAIYQDYWSRDFEMEVLKLSEFIEGGGRVLFVYFKNWAEFNEITKRLFGMSIVLEQVVDDDGIFFYDTNMLPSYMSGMDVVSYGNEYVEIESYLMTNREGGERGYLESQKSGLERMMYFSSSDRSITFYPAAIGHKPNTYVFFDDACINNQDNEAAALALLNYLLGR